MSNNKTETRLLELAEFAKRFPGAFSTEGRDIVPLEDDICQQVVEAMRCHSAAGKIAGFIDWYAARFEYQRAVALGMRKRNLHGDRVGYTSQPERDAARQLLLKQGRWNSPLAKMFKQNTLLGQ